jgi:iron complex outermembrane receptor protein
VAFAQGGSEEEFTLEEITVTAEKRVENVQKTSIAITAISADTIRTEALNTLGAAMKDAAGVEVASSITGGQIYIRGIGAYGGEPATAVLFDEVYSGRTTAISSAMYDVGRVEVLRGPQGTLYGRNATGGIVNVVSNNPVDKFEILANMQIGNFNLKHFDGAINIPLSEKWAARVALLQETRDGYLSCGAADSNKFSTRVKMLYNASEKFTVLATFDYNWEKSHGNNTVPIPGSAGKLPMMGPPGAPVSALGWKVPDENGDGIADDLGDPTTYSAGGPPGSPGGGPPDLNPDGIPDIVQTGWIVPAGADAWTNDRWHPAGSFTNKQKIFSIKMDLDMNWAQLTLIPSYTDVYSLNVDNMLLGIATSVVKSLGTGQGGTRQQYTAEARLASPADSSVKWLAGYYGMKMPQQEMNQQDPTTYSDNRWHFVNKRDPDMTHALFGQATVPITDRFRVTGGIRYSQDTNSTDYRYGNSDVSPTNPLYADTNGTGVYDSGWLHYEQDVKSTTYKAGIEFDPGKDSMVYAQVSTGFKQGGLNMTLPPKEYKPEELVAYEFGSKNRFMNGRMQLNLEGYYYQYTNMQAQFPVAYDVAATGSTEQAQAIFNAEEGTNKGIDIELDYLVTQNDKINAAIALVDAKYGEVVDNMNGERGLPPNPDFGTTTRFSLKGRQVAMSPDWCIKLGYEHTVNLDNGAFFMVGFDTKISDGYWTTAEQYLAGAWQDRYTRSNFNASYTTEDGKWVTSVSGKNLENKAQTNFIVPFYRRFVNEPRTFVLNVSYKF